MFNGITGSDKWKKIEFINKGWSDDKKYHIITEDDKHLLLRISDQETYESKKYEYEIIKKLSTLDFESSTPYDFGICQEGVYVLMTWIEGEDMRSALPKLSFSEQYNLGIKAGQILNKIHGICIEHESFDWYEKYTKKMDRKIRNYNNCKLKYDNGELFIEYINKTKNLLKNRPITLCHGDFHVGNMIYSGLDRIGIIDYNSLDFEDPWQEFNRIVWDVEISEAFAIGRLNGYFNHQIPNEFFQLLALYISVTELSSLPWAEQYGEKQIKIMKDQAKMTLYHYDNFKTVIPKWYKKTMERDEKL